MKRSIIELLVVGALIPSSGLAPSRLVNLAPVVAVLRGIPLNPEVVTRMNEVSLWESGVAA